MTTTTLT